MDETYRDDIIEALKKENKELKKKYEQLERSNEGLVKLSLLLAAAIPPKPGSYLYDQQCSIDDDPCGVRKGFQNLDRVITNGFSHNTLGGEWCDCSLYDMNKKG